MVAISVQDAVQARTGRRVRSLRRDVLGVVADDNPSVRSLRDRIELMRNRPMLPVALVAIVGAAPTVQRDLDNANLVYSNECGFFVHPMGLVTADRPELLVLAQTDCLGGTGHGVSAEEDQLFSLGRNLGARLVGYYVQADTSGFAGCAAHPPGRRGFWVGDVHGPFTFAHEILHVIGDNQHVSDRDNLMFGGGTTNITNLPPDLATNQCERAVNDPEIRAP